MNLCMSSSLCAEYKSRTQQARVVTEAWAASNTYCAACDQDSLVELPRNEPAADLWCECCDARYQLKSSSRPFKGKVVDSAYETMMAAIRSDKTPNLFLLQYDTNWTVSSLFLIPRFCFTSAAIEKRKPLCPSARRAGWIGCNILLSAIAPDALIPLVHESIIVTPNSVRRAYNKLRPLTSLRPELRGWTLNVLNIARRLNKVEFHLTEVYGFEPELAKTYPGNKNIRAKIRQQLQVLRDMGIISFLGGGKYAFSE